MVNQNNPRCMYRVAFFLSYMVLCTLTACFSLQSSYPPITYYRLQSSKPITPEARKPGLIPGTMLIKTFSIDAEWDNEQLFTISGTTVQPLMYHRWSSEPNELVGAFVINRILQTGMFSGGIITEQSGLAPDYTIEVRIIEMGAFNSGEQAPSVNIILHCMMYRHRSGAGNTILLQKHYECRTRRNTLDVVAIPTAMSESLSVITDSLFVDVKNILVVRR